MEVKLGAFQFLDSWSPMFVLDSLMRIRGSGTFAVLTVSLHAARQEKGAMYSFIY